MVSDFFSNAMFHADIIINELSDIVVTYFADNAPDQICITDSNDSSRRFSDSAADAISFISAKYGNITGNIVIAVKPAVKCRAYILQLDDLTAYNCSCRSSGMMLMPVLSFTSIAAALTFVNGAVAMFGNTLSLNQHKAGSAPV